MRNKILNIKFWNQKRIFWLLHITGWLFIFALMYGVTASKIVDFWGFSRLATFYIGGFLVTTALRYWLRKVVWRNRSLFGLLAMLLGIAIASTLLVYVFHFVTGYPTLHIEPSPLISPREQYFELFWFYIFTNHTLVVFIVIFLWMVLYFGLKYFIDLNIQRERAQKAQVEAQKAQLNMLRYQLNPHFLFNSLNSIWALADEDPRATKSMINELSDFLRYSLLHDQKAFKPLEHEIDALKNYFSIEKKRFQDKLVVDFNIDPDTNHIPVLSFFMQPFVENAIKFGMKTSPMPLRITITTKKKEDCLNIQISNTGKWIRQEDKLTDDLFYTGTGMGLDNIRKRMEIAYPENHTIEYKHVDDSVTVNILIPVTSNQ